MRFDPQSNYVSHPRRQTDFDEPSSPGMQLWIILFILLTLGGVGFIVWTQIQPVAANAIHKSDQASPRELAITEWVDQLEKRDPERFRVESSTGSKNGSTDSELTPKERAECRSAYEKGRAFMELGEHERAIPHFQQAVEINPQWTDAHYALGLAYCMTDADEDAMAEVEVLRRLDPNLANLLSNLLR